MTLTQRNVQALALRDFVAKTEEVEVDILRIGTVSTLLVVTFIEALDA